MLYALGIKENLLFKLTAGFFFSAILLCGCAKQVCFEKTCLKVEVTDTPSSRQKGLMLRDHLAPGSGMLFVFDRQDIYPFWMKNMRFPIDIIWISEDKLIAAIAENVVPCKGNKCDSILPQAKARYVLEARAGFVKEHRLVLNSAVVIDE